MEHKYDDEPVTLKVHYDDLAGSPADDSRSGITPHSAEWIDYIYTLPVSINRILSGNGVVARSREG